MVYEQLKAAVGVAHATPCLLTQFAVALYREYPDCPNYVLTPLEGLLGVALAGLLITGLVGAGRARQVPAGAAAATISPSNAPKST